jgi:hypothetical protein
MRSIYANDLPKVAKVLPSFSMIPLKSLLAFAAAFVVFSPIWSSRSPSLARSTFFPLSSFSEL